MRLLLLLALLPSGWAAPITALVFSPDGKELVCGGAGLEIRPVKDGGVSRTIPCGLTRITSLAFQPGTKILAVGGGAPGVEGSVEILDWRSQKVLQRIINHTDLVTSVAFNGELLGVASADHSAGVWRLDSTWREAFALTGHAGPVLAIAFSPSGKTVVTASADRSVKVWSAEDGKLIRSFSHHTDPVHALVFRPRVFDDAEDRPALCVTGGDDRTARVWQPEIGRMVRIVRQHHGPIFALAYRPDARTFFSAGKEGIVRRIDGESDAIIEQWKVSEDWIYAMAVSPDGSTLATGDWAGSVQVRSLQK